MKRVSLFCKFSRRNQSRTVNIKRSLHFGSIVAIFTLMLIGGTVHATLMNADIVNDTGDAADDYHIEIATDTPFSLYNTYNFGGDVQFPTTNVSGIGTNNVTFNWSGATVNSGQDTHVGFSVPWNARITKSHWTTGGTEVLPRDLGLTTGTFNEATTDYIVAKVELWDDIFGTNLVGTMWWEGQGTDVIIENFSDRTVFASWSFTDPGGIVALEDLNHTLGGFGPETAIVELIPEPATISLIALGGLIIRRRKSV